MRQLRKPLLYPLSYGGVGRSVARFFSASASAASRCRISRARAGQRADANRSFQSFRRRWNRSLRLSRDRSRRCSSALTRRNRDYRPIVLRRSMSGGPPSLGGVSTTSAVVSHRVVDKQNDGEVSGTSARRGGPFGDPNHHHDDCRRWGCWLWRHE
jgi:hypothetical protein